MKDFDITESSWIKKINFHPEDWENIFDIWNSFELEKIIDLDTLKLKSNSQSPFIDYLISNNLER